MAAAAAVYLSSEIEEKKVLRKEMQWKTTGEHTVENDTVAKMMSRERGSEEEE